MRLYSGTLPDSASHSLRMISTPSPRRSIKRVRPKPDGAAQRASSETISSLRLACRRWRLSGVNGAVVVARQDAELMQEVILGGGIQRLPVAARFSGVTAQEALGQGVVQVASPGVWNGGLIEANDSPSIHRDALEFQGRILAQPDSAHQFRFCHCRRRGLVRQSQGNSNPHRRLSQGGRQCEPASLRGETAECGASGARAGRRCGRRCAPTRRSFGGCPGGRSTPRSGTSTAARSARGRFRCGP